jgi:hypothetical protein
MHASRRCTRAGPARKNALARTLGVASVTQNMMYTNQAIWMSCFWAECTILL